MILLLGPILIPLLAAVCCVLVRRSLRAQRLIAVGGSLALLANAILLVAAVLDKGYLVAHMGNWPPPFGITFVADLFSAAMVLITGIIALALAAYSLGSIDTRREAFGYHPLSLILLMGVCGAFLTGDLFNMYVWFEVMLMSSFVLLTLGGERGQLEGGLKYVTLNMLSSAFFLTGLGLLYGYAGTLNMADLARKMPEISQSGHGAPLALMFLVAFGIKAGMFPMFFWLPASYHTPPAAVSALFAALLTKVGVYALIRAFTLVFATEAAITMPVILVLSALTMLVGVLGAYTQSDFRRILSFHIISQIGYMTLGLGFFTRAGLAAAVFYILHHIIVKANLFLVSGVVKRLRGSYELPALGGVYHLHPFVAFLFMIPAMSLAGIPPLSGFWAKFAIVRAGMDAGEYALVAVSLFVGLVTLLSMTKIWGEVFWKNGPEIEERPEPHGQIALMIIPIVSLAAITVAIGLVAGPMAEYAFASADQLMDPQRYIQAVLGSGEGEP